MGVYIKGMEIPEFCAVCTIADWEYDCCPVAYRKNIRITDTSGRPKFCPLVAVPDHGDLIDVDVLRQVMRVSDSCNRCERDAYKCQVYGEMTVMDVCETIDDMPVVIPAERSEDPSHPFADSVMMEERSEE